MNSRTGSSRTAPATRRRNSRKGPQHLIGSAAVALIAMGCGWTLYSNLFAGDVPAATASVRAKSVMAAAADLGDAQSSFAERFDQVSFADRFAAAVVPSRAVQAAPTPAERQVAWFDPGYSLGAPPERFAPRAAPAQVAAVPTPQEVVSPAPTVKQLVASIPVPAQRPSELRVVPRPAASGHELMVQRARATVLAAAATRNPTMFEKLFGKEPQPVTGTQLAFAGTDGGITGDGKDIVAAAPSYDRQTAVYDISAKKVYLPDGTTLEAHSGLGNRLDNPKFAHERMRGVTPPHVYDLKPREALFHGVAALRLTPVGGESAIYGRNGLLAHTYMLGPNGDSNGCVSFKDYNKFLQAYRNGDVRRLVVVASLN